MLLRKEIRELASSRAMLLVAAAIGPLVAQAYHTAVSAFAEASGAAGGAAALSQGLSPLDGIVSPTFGAYAIAATLLFPFVAIRVVSAEKESGAHLLALQAAQNAGTIVITKFIALLGAWLLLWIPGLLALCFWSAAGGHLNAAETAGVLCGHLLRGAFISALGIACAAATESGASAAVLALAVTISGWAIDFTAIVRGGWVAELARFTPDAALRAFERGQMDASLVAVAVLTVTMLLAAAELWLDPARPRNVRTRRLGMLLVFFAIGAPAAGRFRQSWDVSEDRRNSFSGADARALRAVTQPLRVEVHLGPADPRLADLERDVFSKLRRTMQDVTIVYAAQTSTGLFEGAGSGYGEIWYALGGQRAMSRSSVPAIVLETIFGLAHVAAPPPSIGEYPGYPARSNVAGWQMIILLAVWPLVVGGVYLSRRRRVPSQLLQ